MNASVRTRDRRARGIDFGRAVLTLGGSRVSGRLDIRTMVVVVVLTVVALVVAVLSLGIGDYPMTPDRVVASLFGGGSRIETMVVREWRMPRVLLAVLLGGALGVSGAIFQSLTRNPLGSPDVIGFNVGAYTGALAMILLVGGDYFATAAGALVGGIVTALAVYLLAFKRGVQGFRLIIVGIAISAMLGSVNTWLILEADLDAAMSAAVWGAGSLNGVGWSQAGPVVVVLAVVLIPLVLTSRWLPMLDLGDDAAQALGVRTERSRLTLIVLGVSLTALATAAAGPIAFVALAAPQLARRLTRTAGVTLLPSAAMGASLLVIADLLAQRLFAPIILPVGVVTVSIGGLYLVWLIAHEASRR